MELQLIAPPFLPPITVVRCQVLSTTIIKKNDKIMKWNYSMWGSIVSGKLNWFDSRYKDHQLNFMSCFIATQQLTTTNPYPCLHSTNNQIVSHLFVCVTIQYD